jgi:hypothetical protein
MSIVDRVLPVKPTAEEIKEGKPVREAYRNDLLAKQELLSKLNTEVSVPLKISQDKLNDLLAKYLAWINVNIEVKANDVTTEQTKFNESFDTLVKEFNNKAAKAFEKNPSQEIINRYPFPEGQKELQNIMNASLKNKKPQAINDSDGFWDAMKWAGTIIIFCFAIRAASFAANENLYLPLGYRILKFIYTLLFFPIWIPYYLYIEIKNKIWPSIEQPKFESVFPITPYDPNAPMDLNKRFFGYPNIAAFNDWITKKQNEWKQEQIDALQGNMLEQLLAEK